MDELLADLRAETSDLDRIVTALPHLDLPTPAEGWTVRDTVSHLAMTDREALRAATDPDDFAAVLQTVFASPDGFIQGQIDEGRAMGEDLLPWWRVQREALCSALADLDPATRLPWYGPSMSPASFATARLMEYWAHGLDVADAAGVRRAPTARLRHIAFLGVRTRGFSYAVRGLTPPDGDVYVALTAPDGELWTWGDPTSPDRVEGPAEDFCLLVTQRRLREDLALKATGAAADEWLSIAQCFAGLPTTPDPKRRGLQRPSDGADI
jgi:uncharacterized protein (TIGR03084 family)